jgi:hypothetical protein
MKLFLVICTAIFLFVGTAMATDYTFKEQTIKVEQKKDYLEITIVNKQMNDSTPLVHNTLIQVSLVPSRSLKEPMIYRVYPCGEVQMQEWKQLAPSKEQQTQPNFYWSSGNNLTLTPIYDITPNVMTLENKLFR